MSRTERRNAILQLLKGTGESLSGSALSEKLDVSRQVIVQDIAVLKASGYDIISTNRGYCLASSPSVRRTVKMFHTDADIEDELNTIVDLGGRVLDVFVKHKAYGELHAQLPIGSRREIRAYLENIRSGKSVPLKNLTSNYHYHTLEAPDDMVMDLIIDELQKKNMTAPLLDYEH